MFQSVGNYNTITLESANLQWFMLLAGHIVKMKKDLQ